MDMGSTAMIMGTSTMAMSATTATSAVAAATSTMSMSMSSSSCKISMLWNWYTVDSCFIASSWHVTSNGMFAGSCIGVIILVMALEFLRRLGKEYDRFLVRASASATQPVSSDSEGSPQIRKGLAVRVGGVRPTPFQQAIRAFLHLLQFGVAYFIMLLAMYYNGYFIICILIGAFLGSFVFSWETLGGVSSQQTSAGNEATVCCG